MRTGFNFQSWPWTSTLRPRRNPAARKITIRRAATTATWSLLRVSLHWNWHWQKSKNIAAENAEPETVADWKRAPTKSISHQFCILCGIIMFKKPLNKQIYQHLPTTCKHKFCVKQHVHATTRNKSNFVVVSKKRIPSTFSRRHRM